MENIRLEVIKALLDKGYKANDNYTLKVAGRISDFVEYGYSEPVEEKPYDKDFFNECVRKCFDNGKQAIEVPADLLKAKILSEILAGGDVPTYKNVRERIDKELRVK